MKIPLRTGFLDFASLRPADLMINALTDKLVSVQFWDGTTDAQLTDRLSNLEVVVVNKIILNEEHLDQAPALKLICVAATGTDNVDIQAAHERGIAVTNIRNYCTPAVVQHVFALILSLTQNLGVYRDRIAAGDWQKNDNFCLLEPPYRELSGKTLGIIGLGALGSSVASVARAFNMRVIAARLPRSSSMQAGAEGQSAPRVSLHDLLQQADIVCLHCPLG